MLNISAMLSILIENMKIHRCMNIMLLYPISSDVLG